MEIKHILNQFKEGNLDLEATVQKLSDNGLSKMGFATLDMSRQERTGIPEVLYAKSKTTEQVAQIAERMFKNGIDILATKASPEMFDAIRKFAPQAEYNEIAQTITYKHHNSTPAVGHIAIITAGTSDLPVSEEAAVTARFLNNHVETINDVGVAGLHRLLNKLETIKKAKVIIVIAGMEGALASVLAGLVDKPIIGVPTSIGYGANFNGISALLSMLTSCANGISVVNIDNGFGAACQASLINHL